MYLKIIKLQPLISFKRLGLRKNRERLFRRAFNFIQNQVLNWKGDMNFLSDSKRKIENCKAKNFPVTMKRRDFLKGV